MHITVLTVPDCPHAALARERIALALDGRPAEVELVEITDEEHAARLGMTGSPTILVDGGDPFASPGGRSSVSCRLYRGPDGVVDGAPGVADLRRALDIAELRAPDGDTPPLDAAGRAGRGRLAPAEGGLRAVQQAVLRHFSATGRAPEPGDLEDAAGGVGRAAPLVLAELAAEDFLTLDSEGQILAAYPFSAVPTPHRIRLPGGVQAWSMCAIDALGTPAMLGTDAVISSYDPATGEPITVTSADGRMAWEPATAVVYVGQRSCTGPAAAVCCDVLNFFGSTASAQTWARAHPDISGGVVDQDDAAELGREIFGHLLGGSAGAPSVAEVRSPIFLAASDPTDC